MVPILILTMLLVPLIACCAKEENLVVLEPWGNGAPELSIFVPMGYTVEKHKGPDFDVHAVDEFREFLKEKGVPFGWMTWA